ncbi:uncharacterized protein BDZ99DRAFT_221763 [Mytilinidion resinicola]|uniref:PNPLA domain-containing protein n=1 Tax=Mytilinidion resinicola TaxID=574789 RepID=A0A6A6XZS7_9PEZI|nr:uncharacterized protein BDZ99DRAFT_221763 [Mytilinidion resinicola]KAF2801475.1 hypothetical protein BDZ99DRAFT_221763 [Mytilinidion resinicola]
MPDHELRLLSLDGGGVRGLSMLQILKKLMEVVDPESPPKPCDYFDMIGGTSTGGLLAIMLGRLRMTVDECLDEYVSLSDRVFQKQRHRVTLKGNVQGRFDSAELERGIKEIIVRQGLAEDALLKDDADAKCKVFVCATSAETSDTVQLTSYRSPGGSEQLLRSTKIWEAGRATSAASSFFDPITIGDFNEGFVDGATGANNPVYEVWNEAQDIWPSGSLEEKISCFVSIGTGVPSLKPFSKKLVGIPKNLVAIATETEKTAERFCRDKSALDNKGRYYRFNVLRGLEDIGLEDSKQKNAIIAATNRYIKSQAVTKQMRAFADGASGIPYVGNYRTPFSLRGVPVVTNFVDRPSDMAKLEQALLPQKQHPRKKVFVLHGLGGMGKTQLAVEFSRKHRQKFSSAFWLDGRTEDSLKQSIATCASRIPQGQIAESSSMHQATGAGDIDAVVKDVQSWLSLPDNTDWLMVFDNVDQDFREPQAASGAYDVRRYFPGADHGSILITTRLVNLAQLGTGLQVDRVDNKQALAIFQSGYGRVFEESEASKELLRLLNCLPLALSQASAFMRETATTFADYVEFYNGQWRELMGSQNDSQTPLQEYQNGSVWTTWTISYRAVRRRDETAAKLLLLWACLDNKDFWFELLAPTPQYWEKRWEEHWEKQCEDHCEEYCEEHCKEHREKHWAESKKLPEWFRTVAGSKVAFTQAMKLLINYSLIEGTQGLPSYAAHPVVHQWAWQMQEEDARAEYCWLAAIIIGTALIQPSSEKESWVLQRRLLPHADRWVSRGFQIIKPDIGTQGHLGADIADALFNMGSLYAEQGKLDKAVKMYKQALQTAEKAVGAEHTSTLAAVNNLGILYTKQGKLSEAEKMFKQALQGYKNVLGLEDEFTLNTANNLGAFYANQGKLGEAEAMYEQTLQGKQEALGVEHTSTFATLKNLARLYVHQGKPGKAEKMYEQALQGTEKALGAEHPSTLRMVAGLGNIYKIINKPNKAEKMHKRALQGMEKTLGAEHLSTLDEVYNLGCLYLKQGRLGEADNMFQRALQGYNKAIGLENISTFIPALQTMRALASLLVRQNRVEEAKILYSKALSGHRKVLGDDHPNCRELHHKLALLGDKEELARAATERDAVQADARLQNAVESSAWRENPASRRQKVLRMFGLERTIHISSSFPMAPMQTSTPLPSISPQPVQTSWYIT